MLFFTLVLVFFLPPLAAEPLVLDGPALGQYLGKSMHVLSPENPTSPATIAALFAEGKGVPSLADRPNFGISPDEHWTSLKIVNPGEPRVLMLENNFGLIDHFDVYQQIGQQLSLIYRGGDQEAFSNRSWLVRSNNVLVTFPAGESMLFMRTQGQTVNILSPRLWDQEEYRKQVTWETTFIGFLTGIFVVMILYNLFLAMTMQDSLYFKYIGFVAINVVFHLSSYNVGQWLAFEWFGLETYSNHIQLFSVDFIVILGVLFIWQFLDLDSSRYRKARPFALISLGLCLFNICVVHAISDWLTTIMTLVLTTYSITVFIVLGFLRLREGYRPALYYLLSWLFYLIGASQVCLIYFGLLELTTYAYWSQILGGAVEVTLFSIALGSRFNFIRRRHARQIRDLNDELQIINLSLEEKVAERTQDVQDILSNINQGIFSVNEHGLIGKDYSRQLEGIFEQSNLADQNIVSILSERGHLKPDQVAQVKSALDSIIDQDIVAFEMNAHLLPDLVQITTAEGKIKDLEFDWNQLTLDNKTRKILGAVRDITERKQLQRELFESSRENHMISQLIGAKPEHFIQFIKVSMEMLDELQGVLLKGEMSLKDLEQVMIVYHTLKGMSRTLKLDELSSLLHQAESEIVQLSDQLTKPIATDSILASFSTIKGSLDDYRRINQQKLGRMTDPGNMLVPKQVVLDVIAAIDTLPNLDLKLKNNLRKLKRSYFKMPEDLIFEQLDAVKKICDQMQSPLPKFIFFNDALGMHPYAAEALEKILIHLISNSLAHGLEKESERLRSGKAERGTIRISQKLSDSNVVTCYEDDGRGVSLAAIRERALAKFSDRPLHDETTLINMLFESGFSTRDQADALAGRGIGLKAVRTYAENLGGRVEIEAEAIPGDPDRRRLRFNVSLPKTLFQIIDENHEPTEDAA